MSTTYINGLTIQTKKQDEKSNRNFGPRIPYGSMWR
jgi:hypothetical protein